MLDVVVKVEGIAEPQIILDLEEELFPVGQPGLGIVGLGVFGIAPLVLGREQQQLRLDPIAVHGGQKVAHRQIVVELVDGLQEDDVIVVFKHFGIELLHEDILIVPRRLTVAYGVPGDLQTDAVGRRQLQKLAVHVRGPDETVAQHQDPVRLALVQNFKIKGDGPTRGRIRGPSRV